MGHQVDRLSEVARAGSPAAPGPRSDGEVLQAMMRSTSRSAWVPGLPLVMQGSIPISGLRVRPIKTLGLSALHCAGQSVKLRAAPPTPCKNACERAPLTRYPGANAQLTGRRKPRRLTLPPPRMKGREKGLWTHVQCGREPADMQPSVYGKSIVRRYALNRSGTSRMGSPCHR